MTFVCFFIGHRWNRTGRRYTKETPDFFSPSGKGWKASNIGHETACARCGKHKVEWVNV